MKRKLIDIMHNADNYTRKDLLDAFDRERDVLFVDDNGNVCEMFFNADSTCGGTFVVNNWEADDILCASRSGRATADEFWSELDYTARQYNWDIDEDDMQEAADIAVEFMCDADIEATLTTLHTHENMLKLLELVDDARREA